MDNDVDIYKRDFIGYGGRPPAVHWPKKANTAVNFVLNYEAGSERTVRNGDPCLECFLSDIVGTISMTAARCAQMESIYEYGSRAGFRRLRDLFRGGADARDGLRRGARAGAQPWRCRSDAGGAVG
jgi:hypothetical protein